MAWLIVLDGGSVAIESESPDTLISEVESNPAYITLREAIQSEGFEFLASADSDDGDDERAVFMLGKELLPDRYLCKGQVASLNLMLSGPGREKADHFLDQLDALLEGAGHTTVRASGIVIHHFD